ncbi:dimethylnonatriene synthase [Quercus suber]|uniref:dimethylnonatriene synthase n=1 Tax=Quercus suber TaxID=58331 RepID=UPI0032DE8124
MECVGIPEPSGALPFIGHLHLVGGEMPIVRTLGAMADKHGSFFSLKMGLHRMLVVSSWEMVKEFPATNDRTIATRPSRAIGEYMFYNNATFALAAYGEYWRDVRKMATLKLLSDHRLEKLKHVRFSEVESLIKDLYLLSTENKVVTISELFEHMTFNISLRMIVGKRFSIVGERNSEASRFHSAIKDSLYLSGVFVLSNAIPYLEWMDYKGYLGSMKRTAKELDSVLDIWLDEHLQKQLEQKSNGESDFMDLMLSSLDEDAVISGHTRDVIVKATALVLIISGSESTSITLKWVLSLLLNHPYVLKAAQEELELHVGKDKWVEESDIRNLNYLQAIIKETLRLYPLGPVTGLREAMEDCNVGGYYVPKGTRLIINIWKLQRDPRVWSNPSEFEPERFMTTHANVDVRGQNFEYIPFNSGRRSCPGLTFGMQVVHLALACLLQGFDIMTVGGAEVDMREGSGMHVLVELKMRKMTMLELLSSRWLDTLKNVQVIEVDTLIKDLYTLCKSNEPNNQAKVVISECIEHLTFNIITKMIAGKRYFGNLNDGNDEEIYDGNDGVSNAVAPCLSKTSSIIENALFLIVICSFAKSRVP